MKRFLAPITFFTITGALALLSQFPLVLVLGLFAAIIPGLVLLASNTVFAYGLALLPLYVAAPELKRASWIAPVALIPALLLAVVPHIIAKRD